MEEINETPSSLFSSLKEGASRALPLLLLFASARPQTLSLVYYLHRRTSVQRVSRGKRDMCPCSRCPASISQLRRLSHGSGKAGLHAPLVLLVPCVGELC